MSETTPNPSPEERPIAWAVSRGPVDYLAAVAAMEARAEAISRGEAPELIWLLQHPPLYTAGTSAREADLIDPDRLPVYRTGRGGRLTYHGPGQRVIYVMLDVKARSGDVRRFVASLEEWIIAVLGEFGITGEPRADRVGVWVRRPDKGANAEDKIAAIGLRLKRWVSLHGISFNVCPALDDYDGIVPCGISGYGVTSLVDLDVPVSIEVVDNALRTQFERRFGPTQAAAPPIAEEGCPRDALQL